MVPVGQVLRENIRSEPWKLGQPHEPTSWREETDGNLRGGGGGEGGTATKSEAFLPVKCYHVRAKRAQDSRGRPEYDSVRSFLNSDT